jgi:hypothetical protein
VIPVPEWLLLIAAIVSWLLWLCVLIRERMEREADRLDEALALLLDEQGDDHE